MSSGNGFYVSTPPAIFIRSPCRRLQCVQRLQPRRPKRLTDVIGNARHARSVSTLMAGSEVDLVTSLIRFTTPDTASCTCPISPDNNANCLPVCLITFHNVTQSPHSANAKLRYQILIWISRLIRMSAGSLPKSCGFILLSAAIISPSIVQIGR